MKRLHQYGLIILLGTGYAVLFNDYFLPLTVVPLVLLLAIVLDGVRDYKQRRNETMLDRKGMMKEIQGEALKLVNEGKASDHKTALKQLKTSGVWNTILQKFRHEDKTAENNTAKKSKEEKTMEKPKNAEKFPWTFTTPEENNANTIPIEVANEKGREYAALIRAVLDTGTTDWKSRINDLDSLQAEMENVVANLRKSYEEIKQERALVTHLAKLKNKEVLE